MSLILKEKVSQDLLHEFHFYDEGKDRFRVATPFLLKDSDFLMLVLKKEGDHWIVSDEGDGFMRLTLHMSWKHFSSGGTREKLLEGILSEFQITDRDGELIIPVENDNFGTALYRASQAILKILNLSFLERDKVRSTFFEDFQDLFYENFSDGSYKFDWSHPEKDKARHYSVDCRVEGATAPVFIYALNNDNKLGDAEVSIYKFHDWNLNFKPVAILEKSSAVSQKRLDRFSEVCNIYFTGLGSQRSQIVRSILELAQS